ncbi:hypothetical protein [Marinicella sp. W31]|uniref:hypothetical protein n=1 Tax=Marinicella sp. W31 TaxID=3023713 RepID=UPI003758442C
MNKLSILILLFLTSSISAQVADIELSASFEFQDDVIPGQVREFSLTITNNGPDSVPTPTISSGPWGTADGRLFYEFSINPAIQQDCTISFLFVSPLPGALFGGTVTSFDLPELESGESITCYGLYIANIQVGTDLMSWIAFSLGSSVNDPNLDNNTWLGGFTNRPVAVNVMNGVSLLILFVMLLLLAMYHKDLFSSGYMNRN